MRADNDIRGAFGTIKHDDHGPRKGIVSRIITFFAIVGPGLIVMVGDNDAGAFGTYTQAGQDYGTSLLWTLLLLLPVLYINQEMVLRLGAVTGVGHARLILERFGKFWGAFSVIDLFLLNALTLVTEFIGISLACSFFGVPKFLGIAIAAVLLAVAVSMGSLRRFERFAMVLCVGSLLIVPVVVLVHPPFASIGKDLCVPSIPKGDLSVIMLLIIGIVGTTIAPWQLFFQQSYVIDKRITPRFIAYERWDLAIGIIFVLIGAIAMVAIAAGAFAGRAEFGNFADAGQVAAGIARYFGHVPATLFAIALADASLIGAAAVGLSTAYAVGDLMAFDTTLHRKVKDAPYFYAVYLLLIVIAAVIVATPGSPLGLLTNAVQVLAGVLLPSATVFLLLLCNDREVLGPWANGVKTNVATALVLAALVMLSVILTASVLFPSFGKAQILWTLGIGTVATLAIGVWTAVRAERHPLIRNRELKAAWKMPSLMELKPTELTPMTRLWLMILRVYLVGAVVLVVFRVCQIALAHGSL